MMDKYDKLLVKIARYREHKNDDMFDDFYHCDLDIIEECIEYKRKNEKVMENKTFVKLVKTNTREEFKKQYKVEGIENCMFLADTIGNFILECPWIKYCKFDENCNKCWNKALTDAKFKGEI